VKVAALVGARDVSRVQPSLIVDRLPRRFRTVEVTEHDLRASNPEFAVALASPKAPAARDIDDAAFGARKRYTHGPVERFVVDRRVRRRAGFGQPVALLKIAAESRRAGLDDGGPKRSRS
jgi:hypothetical protein